MLSRSLLSKLRPTTNAAMDATRSLKRFNYPHSYTGANSTLTNIPQKNVYPDLKRSGQEAGDKPELAHQNVREFPDWYKPYSFNYSGDGYLALFFGGSLFLGWMYTNDIKEMKGRKQRKKYMLNDHDVKGYFAYDCWATRQLEKDDPNWTKFLPGKTHRAAAHH